MTRGAILGAALVGVAIVAAVVRLSARPAPAASTSPPPIVPVATATIGTALPARGSTDPVDPTSTAMNAPPARSTTEGTAQVAPLSGMAPTVPSSPSIARAPSPSTVTDPLSSASPSGSSPSTTSEVQGGFGTTAAARAPKDAPATTPRTWLRPENLKVTIGQGTVDVATADDSAMHTGAQLPILTVGGRAYRSSTYRTPSTLRFTEVGPVAPDDEITISYGDGKPIVLRKGGSR